VDPPCAETLELLISMVLTLIYTTHINILTTDTSKYSYKYSSKAYSIFHYHILKMYIVSVFSLIPVTSLAQENLKQSSRPVSYYAFFNRLLLPSILPGCLDLLTSLSTKLKIRDLNKCSGLFPSRLIDLIIDSLSA